jgi:SAM-dependent methyltransferase
MNTRPITFDDGEAYEGFMGKWSRLVGEIFLDWIAQPAGLRWVDIGCGNGAFTDLLLTRAAAAHVDGIDPSPGQLKFAQTRLAGRPAAFHLGPAAQLPFADDSFDAAAMALVLFFVPEPEKGVAEMVRVTKPGGAITAYVWDVLNGGFPSEPAADPMRAFGIEPGRPPRADISTLSALQDLWTGAGLEGVATRTIEVVRDFENFDDWWSAFRGAPALGGKLDRFTAPDLARLQAAIRERLPAGPDGHFHCTARANAIIGTRPIV